MSEDFFGDLGKTITKVTQRAVGKTGSMIESSRINSLIAQEEALLREKEIALGKRYYALIRDGAAAADEESAPLVSETGEILDRLLDLRKELAEVRGMKVCPACTELVPPDSTFCPKCGAPMKEPAEEDGGEGSAEENPGADAGNGQ